MEEGPPELRDAIREAIGGVPDDVIASLDRENIARGIWTFRSTDTNTRLRLYVLSQAISRQVDERRLQHLAETPTRRSPPYDHPTLADVEVDDEGLVAMSAFQIHGGALCRGDSGFLICPPVPGSNATYWLVQALLRSGIAQTTRVRLDPLIFGPAADLAARMYRMDIYGRPLDWGRLRGLREPEHGRWMPSGMSRASSFTDYAWIPHDAEVDFVCEELPLLAEVTTRGSRYLHAIYSKNDDAIIHVDGAVRVYADNALEQRLTVHARQAGKVGARAKIFRNDERCSPDALGVLAQAFFVWNYDVARYFGAPIPREI